MSVELTLEEVKRTAKREDFRAGVQMRMLMPRLSIRLTRWILARSRVSPNDITLVSFAIGLAAALAFSSAHPLVVVAALAGFHLHVLLDYVDGEVARCRGLTSVRGAYLDLMTDRVTYPLFVYAAAVGAYRALGQPELLVAGFAGAFGLLLDKEACDAWYRANSGAPELEDRYVPAPDRNAWRRLRGLVTLGVVMSRGLAAFLTYTVVAVFLDSSNVAPPPIAGSWRALVVWAFAVLLPLGAFVRFLFVYRRGVIPRRQQLL
jgi:phosphatidylglycerophosphate synthase